MDMLLPLLITASLFKETPQPKENRITLPDPVRTSACAVEQALQGRRSIRSFTDSSLTLQELSQILWAAYGISGSVGSRGLRTAPSAGACYPLDIYVLAGRVDGLAQGIYKYVPETHSLVLAAPGDFRARVCEAAHQQEMIEAAPASIVYTAVFDRITKRYGARGKERYVYMDLGHSAQNVYLQAYSLHLGTCAIGAFDDEKLKKALPVPGIETPLYIMPIGRIKK
jgi:SagB-type dehydrogenase family enzyme